MKTFAFLLLTCLCVAAQTLAQLRTSADPALTNLLVDVLSDQNSRQRFRMLPWSHDEAPTNRVPVPAQRTRDRSWDFATNRLESLPCRVAVWEYHAEAGHGFVLVAEATIVNTQTSLWRRAIYSGPILQDITLDWTEIPLDRPADGEKRTR